MVELDYVPENTGARALYYSLGFRETGGVEDGEIIMVLPLTDRPGVGALTADKDDIKDLTALIERERAAGVVIPEPLCGGLEDAISAGQITRLTVMGKSIGLARGGALLIARENEGYREAAARRLSKAEI